MIKQTKEIKMAQTTETLKISGMMCDGCENTIKSTIEAVEGVQSAEVSHKEGTAKVIYDSDVADMLFIKLAVNNTHYKVVE